MKKLFSIMLLVLTIGLTTYSQNEPVKTSIGVSKNSYSFIARTTDTIGATDSTFSFAIFKDIDSRIYSHIRVSIDKFGTTADSVDIILKYKVLNSESFTNLDTTRWYGSVDTNFVFETTTALIAKYWELSMNAYSDDIHAKMDSVEFIFCK
jgi:hypothetical protein